MLYPATVRFVSSITKWLFAGLLSSYCCCWSFLNWFWDQTLFKRTGSGQSCRDDRGWSNPWNCSRRGRKVQKKTWARTWESHNYSASGSFSPEHGMLQSYSTARTLQNDFQQATNARVSAQTVRNRLHEYGLRSSRPPDFQNSLQHTAELV